jgi:hypothetical protein
MLPRIIWQILIDISEEYTFETAVNIYQTTFRYISEDRNLHYMTTFVSFALISFRKVHVDFY